MTKKTKIRRKFLAFLTVSSIMFGNSITMIHAEEVTTNETITNNEVFDNSCNVSNDETDTTKESLTSYGLANVSDTLVDDGLADDGSVDDSETLADEELTDDELADDSEALDDEGLTDENETLADNGLSDNSESLVCDESSNSSESVLDVELSIGVKVDNAIEVISANETVDKINVAKSIAKEASERKEQFTTSDGVDVKVTFNDSTKTLEVFYDITDSAEGDVVIALSELIPFLEENYRYIGYGFGNGGSYGLSNINITTSNGHTYKYKDGSFILETADLSNSENLTDFIGFDGQSLPAEFIGNVVKAEPILELYKGDYTKSSLKAYHLIDIYDRLEKKGFTGDNALSNYLLDYYNKKLGGTTYSTITDLYNDHPEVLVTGNWRNPGMLESDSLSTLITAEQYKDLEPKIKNNPYVVVWDYNGQYYIQYKWPDEELAAFSYEFFYDNVLKLYFGTEEKLKELCNGNASNLKENDLKDYMDSYGNSEGLWSEVNQYLNEATKSGLSKENQAKLAIYMAFGFNGNYFANTYQDYRSSWYNSITLEQIDGDITINKVDENGDLITSPTTFNLYYYTMEVDQEESNKLVTYYYAIDENGLSYFTTDVTKAAALITENGSLTVKYLLPDYNYYLKEIVAPEGYELNTEEIELKIISKDTVIASVQSKKVTVPDDSKDDPDEDSKDDSNENPDEDSKDDSNENPDEDLKDDSNENPDKDLEDDSNENPNEDSKDDLNEDSGENSAGNLTETPIDTTNSVSDLPTNQAVATSTNQLDTPKTGDDSNLIIWVIIFIIAVVTIVILLKKEVKHN